MMGDIGDLLTRLEAASEGRAALGAEVLAAVRGARLLSVEQYGEELWIAVEDNSDGERYEIKHLRDPTRSIDAALTLVPAGWPKRLTECRFGAWRVELLSGDKTFNGPVDVDVIHVSWPLALCIAALKARAALPLPPEAGDD